MADEDIHRSMCPLKLLEIELEVGDGVGLWRLSVSRLIHGIALKTSGGERFAETKEIFFRAGGSMSQQRDWMRTRRCGEKSERGVFPVSIIFSTRTPSSIICESVTPVMKQTAATPAMIQFRLISKSPTTEHQIGRAPFGPMD